MADHPHTIDRWDDATGENLIEQIAAVGDYLLALETYRAAVEQDHVVPGVGLVAVRQTFVLGGQGNGCDGARWSIAASVGDRAFTFCFHGTSTG
jgi:hypothetical protein